MYRNPKKERKAWWSSLSDAEKSKYQSKWEHSRDKPDRIELNISPLTTKQSQAINKRMREIGMQRYIVLSD